MKTLFITIVAVLTFVAVQAQTRSIPFSYDKTMEWSKVDAGVQKTLLGYANAGKYDSPATINADSIVQTTLVKGIKSRSGKTEDQVWLKLKKGGKEKNYLFSLSSLPTITGTCCKLTVNAKRGDSDEFN